MSGGMKKEVALSPLNDNWKFFLAHLPFLATTEDVRQHFSQFGTVNFVKLVTDKKTGKSKGYGFLYMNDAYSDSAVESYAIANKHRITMLNKSGVFLARNDQKRQNPIRNPNKKSHDEDLLVSQQQQQQQLQPPALQPYQQQQQQYYQPTTVYPPNNNPQQPYDMNFPHQSYSNGAPGGLPPPPPPAQDPYSSSPYHQQQQQQQQPQLSGVYAPTASSSSSVPALYPSSNDSFQGNRMPQYNATPAPVGLLMPPPSGSNAGGGGGRVLLGNLPPQLTTADDVVFTLQNYSLTATNCYIEYDKDPKATWCYAHIELTDPEHLSRCLALGEQSLLEYRGRIITASIDTEPVPSTSSNEHVPQQQPNNGGGGGPIPAVSHSQHHTAPSGGPTSFQYYSQPGATSLPPPPPPPPSQQLYQQPQQRDLPPPPSQRVYSNGPNNNWRGSGIGGGRGGGGGRNHRGGPPNRNRNGRGSSGRGAQRDKRRDRPY